MAMGSFSIALGRFAGRSESQIVTACQKIAMEAFARVVMRSPVDTGRFRANWGVKIGSPFAGINDTARDTTPVMSREGPTSAQVAWDAAEWNAKKTIYLCNNLSYSTALEYGHSQIQAPGGMVRVSIAEMQGGVAEQVARI